MKSLAALSAAAMALALGQSAGATPVKSVNFVYYSVSGKTLLDIYRSLMARGPQVGDKLAFATTTSHTDQQATLQQTPHSCRFASYQLKMNFTTKLPQLSSASSLSPADQARWQGFAAFVQRHEASHRDIWMGCAARLEADLEALRAVNCADLTRQAVKVAASSAGRCAQLHSAFDSAQKRVLRQQPFIQAVVKQAAK